ncbi:MAG: hypothetical protein ACXIUW_04295 [Roseinatronobacter sp.]
MQKIPSLAAAIVLMAGLAHAQSADATSWTKEEFMAAYPELTDETFDQIDLNDDGMIDPDEYLLAVAAGLITPLEG